MTATALELIRHEVLYRIELSILYHRKRERFFDGADKLAKFVAVVGGSAALSKVGGENLTLIALGITISSALSLVFGFSDKSRRHAALAEMFSAEQVKALRLPMDAVEPVWNALRADIAACEVKEPAALGGLVVICQNELAIAQNQPEKVKQLSWWRRITAYFWDDWGDYKSSEAPPVN